MITVRLSSIPQIIHDIGIEKYLEKIDSLVLSFSEGIEDWLSGRVSGKQIYTLISHKECSEEVIGAQRYLLGMDPDNYYEDIPIFEGEENWELLPKDIPYGVSGVSSPEKLEEIRKITGRKPLILRLPINPLNYPKSAIDYSRENSILLIGTDIFGGEGYHEYLESMFPEEYLQAFGEHNSDIIEIPGEDPYLVGRVFKRTGKIIVPGKLLEYSSDVNRVPPSIIPERKIHGWGELTCGGLSVKFPSDIGGEWGIKKVNEEVTGEKPISWEDPDQLPTDLTDPLGIGAYHRIRSLPYLESVHPGKRWRLDWIRISPDFWVVKVIPKGWASWMWKEHLYWLISGKLYKMPVEKPKNLNSDKNQNK